MISVVFYNTSSDDLRVNKSLGTAKGTYSCDLLEECDITNPKIIVTANSSLIGVNYCYIADYHRYYYAKLTILDGNRFQFDLSVDRLMSFVNPNKANLTGYVERNASDYNMNIMDDQAIFTNDRDIVTKNIGVSGITKTLDNWKLLGVFNAGLCNTGYYTPDPEP